MSDVRRRQPQAVVPQPRRRVEAVGRPMPRRTRELFLQRVGLGWLMLAAAVLLALSTVGGYLIGIRYR